MKYVWKHFDLKNRNLNLDECGIDRFEPHQKHNYIAFQHFLINYVASGSGTFVSDGTSYSLSAGQGFIIKEGAQIQYYGDPDDLWLTYWVGVSGIQLEEFLQNTVLADQCVLQFDPSMKSVQLIQDICHYAYQPNIRAYTDYWYQGKIYELMYYLNEDFGYKNSPNKTTYRYPAEVAHDYILKNYMNNITIQEIAEFIGISRSHLFRLFQDKYQSSPKQFLQDYRMLKAGNLLQGSDLSITEIADRVGYDDPLQFSKLFTKWHSMPPSELRRLHRLKNNHTNEVYNKLPDKNS